MENTSFEIYLHPKLKTAIFTETMFMKLALVGEHFFNAKNSYTEFCGHTSPLRNTFFFTS